MSVADATDDGAPVVINLLGARSSGKTVAGFFGIARHLKLHGEDARILIVRKRLKSLQQYIDDLAAYLRQHVEGLSVNRNVHTISIGGTTVISFGAIDSGNILEFSGRNHTGLIIEEAGDIDTALVDQLALTLRKVNKDHNGNPLPMMFWRLGNPGGSAHLELYTCHIRDRKPWVPYRHGGFVQVTIPGSLEDNPHNPANYEDQFLGLKAVDEGLYRAHRFGDWSAINTGTFFGQAFNHGENIVPPGLLKPGDMRRFLWCGDWGTSSPAAYVLLGVLGWNRELPAGLVLPAGTIVCWDEYATCIEGSMTKGDGRSPGEIIPYLARKTELAGAGGVTGVLDCAVGANVAGHGEQTVLDFHRLASGLHSPRIKWHPAPKGDVQTRMETLREKIALREIVMVEGKVPYLQETLLAQPRDKYEPNLMSKKDGVRHAIDALSYGVTWLSRGQIGCRDWSER